MKITITCNGEYINTHYSTLGRCSDRLSERGILESLRLAQALKNEHFDFIFCSDFGYRRTTTDLIVEELKEQQFKIIVDTHLREKDAETCSQLTKENLIKHHSDSQEQNQILSRLFIKSESIPTLSNTTETEKEVIKRCEFFINQLVHTYPSNSHILIIGNPIINSFLIATLLWENDYTQYITSPCSLSKFISNNGNRTKLSFNERQHLYWPNTTP